jgi:hypothetical protein
MSWSRVAVPRDDLMTISVITDDDTGMYLEDIGEPEIGVTMDGYNWLNKDEFREKLATAFEKWAQDIRSKSGMFEISRELTEQDIEDMKLK